MENLPNYDDWKLACCGRWPSCRDCPYDGNDEDEDEYDDDDESEQF